MENSFIFDEEEILFETSFSSIEVYPPPPNYTVSLNEIMLHAWFGFSHTCVWLPSDHQFQPRWHIIAHEYSKMKNVKRKFIHAQTSHTMFYFRYSLEQKKMRAWYTP